MKLTKRGWQLSSLAVVIALVGRALAVTELIVIGLAILGLGGVSVAWIASARMRLRLRRTLSPIRVHAGEYAAVTLRVTNLGRRTPAFTITDFVTGTSGAVLQTGPLRTAMTSEGSYQLPTGRRGRLAVGPATITVTDPLALAEVTVSVGEATKFVVFPRIVPLPAMAIAAGTQTLASSGRFHSLHRVGEDFYGLRDYTVGDDPRRIHWRSTARLGRPMVREGEIPKQNQMSVLLDTRADSYSGTTGGGTIAESFDLAVTVAASVIATTLDRGDAVKLVTTSGGVVGFSTAAHGAEELFGHLAEVSLTDFGSLRSALGQLGGRDVGALVAVVGHNVANQVNDITAIGSLASQVGSLITLRTGRAQAGRVQADRDQVAQPRSHGSVTTIDVADLSQLPAAWKHACAKAGSVSSRATGRATTSAGLANSGLADASTRVAL